MSVNPDQEADIELESVIEAFQQAIARARETAAFAASDAPAVRYGQQPVYVVQRLAVELNVGVTVRRIVRDGEPRNAVLVQTQAAAPDTRLSFEVNAAPLEAPLEEPSLLITTPLLERDGQPLPAGSVLLSGDEVEVSAFVHNALGAPVPAIPVWLEVRRLSPGPARDNPGAPDAERWTLAADLDRVGPDVTDGRGLASLRFTVPALPAEDRETTLLRIKARAALPVTPGAPVTDWIPERQPQFLKFKLGDALERGGVGVRSLDFTASPRVPTRNRAEGMPATGLTLEGAEATPLAQALGLEKPETPATASTEPPRTPDNTRRRRRETPPEDPDA